MEKNMMLNVESANGMDMPNVKEVCGSLSAYIINKVKKPVDMLQGYYSYVLEKSVAYNRHCLHSFSLSVPTFCLFCTIRRIDT